MARHDVIDVDVDRYRWPRTRIMIAAQNSSSIMTVLTKMSPASRAPTTHRETSACMGVSDAVHLLLGASLAYDIHQARNCECIDQVELPLLFCVFLPPPLLHHPSSQCAIVFTCRTLRVVLSTVQYSTTNFWYYPCYRITDGKFQIPSSLTSFVWIMSPSPELGEQSLG